MTTLRAVKGSELSWVEGDANVAIAVVQASHGFALGDLVTLTGSGWAKAQADAVTTLAHAVVMNVPDSGNFYAIAQDGVALPWTTHGQGSVGDQLYLSQGTAGDWTSTKPSSGYIQPVGVILDANRIIFRLGTEEYI